jgi:hypothetical protein
MAQLARLCKTLVDRPDRSTGWPTRRTSPGRYVPPPPTPIREGRLPGGKEYVEVVQKTPASATTPMTGEVAFYFLKEDGTTPMSPAPTTGRSRSARRRSPSSPTGMGWSTRTGRHCSPRGAGTAS